MFIRVSHIHMLFLILFSINNVTECTLCEFRNFFTIFVFIDKLLDKPFLFRKRRKSCENTQKNIILSAKKSDYSVYFSSFN